MGLIIRLLWQSIFYPGFLWGWEALASCVNTKCSSQMCPCTVVAGLEGLLLRAHPVMALAWFFWSLWGIVAATWSCRLMASGPLCWILSGAGWLLKHPLRGKVSGTGGLGIYWFEGTHMKDCSWPGCAAGSEVNAVVLGLLLGRSLFREIRDQGPVRDSHSLCSGLLGLGFSCAFCFVLAEWP